MVRMGRFAIGAVLALALLTVGPAFADDSSGLGSNWPNTPDVSSNPQFHVYRWVSNGITYIQVNDQAGNVKMAVGKVGTTVFVLPMGAPSTVQIGSTSLLQAPISSAPVYQDSTMVIQQTPSTSTPKFTVQAVCQDPGECSG